MRRLKLASKARLPDALAHLSAAVFVLEDLDLVEEADLADHLRRQLVERAELVAAFGGRS